MAKWLQKLILQGNKVVRRLKAEINYVCLDYARSHYGLNTRERQEQVVVSVACYKDRYNVLPKMLKSVLWQTYKPDRIIVWLDSDTPDNQLTPEMKEMEKHGVTFRFTDDDLKPHKKYFYVMQEYPRAVVVTLDDDVVYDRRLIKKLVDKHLQYPNAVCGGRCHKITWDEQGNIRPYQQWSWKCDTEELPSFELFATGVGGILYPPGLLPCETFSIEKIRELCLRADDIWLKFMELAANAPVALIKNCPIREINGSQKTALNKDNVLDDQNDMYLSRMIEHYPHEYELLKSSSEP